MYESRLELARLVLADFDPAVCAIRSQPMRLSYVDGDGRTRHHVPDFALLYRDDRIRIVNVKPADRLSDPGVRALLDAAHGVLEKHGLETEIWSAEDPVVLSTVVFLAGYRNPRYFDESDLRAARQALHGGMTVAGAEAALRQAGLEEPRSVLLHLMWTRQVRTDLTGPHQVEQDGSWLLKPRLPQRCLCSGDGHATVEGLSRRAQVRLIEVARVAVAGEEDDSAQHNGIFS